MSKYGDTDNSDSVGTTDVVNLYQTLRNTPDHELSFDFASTLVDETTEAGQEVSGAINEFFKLNVHKKYAFAGPAVHELLKVNHVAKGRISSEEYIDADYDFSVSAKGANVDIENDEFIASFPTTLDYSGWDGVNGDPKEVGWVKIYKKNSIYEQYINCPPPIEFIRSQDFIHSDHGLRSLAKSENYVVVSSFLHGNSSTPTKAQVHIYEKLPNEVYVYRHLLEISDALRAPTVDILDDFLFIGNCTNGEVSIYSFSALQENHRFSAKNTTKPIQVLDLSQFSSNDEFSIDSSFFGFSIKSYSVLDKKILFIGSPHLKFKKPEAPWNGEAEVGAVFYYQLENNNWNYKSKIIPSNWENIDLGGGYGFEDLSIKFGFDFDFKFHGQNTENQFSHNAVLLIGAPRYYNSVTSNRREGIVFTYGCNIKSLNDSGHDSFASESTIEFDETTFELSQDDIGEFEFGRSIAIDNENNAWIACNPARGASVGYYTPTHLVEVVRYQFSNEYLISSDRDGGKLVTNGDDIIFGSSENIRVFQEGNVEILKNETDAEYSEMKEHLNKKLPREWGTPPDPTDTELVILPFDYGVGSKSLAEWIEMNSTGDERLSPYIKKIIDEESIVESPSYEYLWKYGNPTLKVIPWSSTIGNVINVHTPHGLLIAEYGNSLQYKGKTNFTMLLDANTPNNKMASWKVNDTFIDGPDKIEITINGEDIDISVDFKRNVDAPKDHVKYVKSIHGEIIISDTKD